MPRFLAVLSLLAVFAWNAWAKEPIRVCADVAGWPPFTYADPMRPERVIGASAELIGEVLQRAGYTPNIVLLPWSRCLAEVESGQVALALDVSASNEREAKFLLSSPYYSIDSALYYMRMRFPQGPRLERTEDLRAYRYCGLFGYNYTMYAIPETRIDSGAKSEASRFEKLRLGRCDFVIGDIELIDQLSGAGALDLTGIDRVGIPGAVPKPFHVAVSRAVANAELLLQRINGGIATTVADKTYARIFRKYGLSTNPIFSSAPKG